MVKQPSHEPPASALSIFEQIRRDVMEAHRQSERMCAADARDQEDIGDIVAMLGQVA